MRYVAFLCHRFCIFCRGDFDPGKMRDKGNGLHCGDGSAHGGSPYLFVAHGVRIGLLWPDHFDQRIYVSVSDPVGRGHGSVLALLLQGAADRRRQ